MNMATNKAQALREKTDQELLDQMALEKKRLFEGVLKGATGEAIKAHQKRQSKLLIAQIQTILRERSLRQELAKQEQAVAARAEGASAPVKRAIKTLEARIEGVRQELAKPEGQRKGKRMPARIQHRTLKKVALSSAADRAAVKLAEVRRRKAALERTDVGQSK